MKLPKTRFTFCPKCKKHTEHKVTEAKKRTFSSVHTQSYGGKIRARARGRLGYGNHGRMSRKPINAWRLSGRKQSKKVDLRYECKDCKKMHTSGKSWRAKKVEFK